MLRGLRNNPSKDKPRTDQNITMKEIMMIIVIKIVIIIIIALKRTIRDFYDLLTAPRTVSNK